MTIIRPMVEADLPQVLGLSEQLGYPGVLSEFNLRFLELKKSPAHKLYVAEAGDKVVGWIHLETVLDLIEKTMTEIKAIVVDQEMRGQRIGHKLIEHAKKCSKEHGLSTIYLNCNIIRHKTHEFYRREGFELDRTSHFFTLDH